MWSTFSVIFERDLLTCSSWKDEHGNKTPRSIRETLYALVIYLHLLDSHVQTLELDTLRDISWHSRRQSDIRNRIRTVCDFLRKSAKTNFNKKAKICRTRYIAQCAGDARRIVAGRREFSSATNAAKNVA